MSAVAVDPTGLASAIAAGDASVEELRAAAMRIAQLGGVHGAVGPIAWELATITDRIAQPVERSRASLRTALQLAATPPPSPSLFGFSAAASFWRYVGWGYGRIREALGSTVDPSLFDLFLFQTRDNVDAFAGLLRAQLRGSEYLALQLLAIAGYNVPSYSFTPTGHSVMFVSGIRSSSASASEWDAAARALGYGEDRRMHYSYRPGSSTYTATDTFQDIERAVGAFDHQMRSAAVMHPGRAIDIVAHSEGGFVAMYWLKKYYDPANPAYPRVANLLTLGSPLQGTPSSDIDRVGNACPGLESDIRAAAEAMSGEALPPDRSPAAEQMRTDSDIVRFIARTPLPPGVHVDAIGARFDYVVPANRAALPGGNPRMVSPASLNQHFALLDDPASIRAMQRALNQQPEPPKAMTQELADIAGPHLTSSIETGVATALRGTVCR